MSFQSWRRKSEKKNSLTARAEVILSLERVSFRPYELECKNKIDKYIQIDPRVTTIPIEHSDVYPYNDKEKICVAMTQINLAEPEWIQIPCDKPLATHVFCHMKDDKPPVVEQSLTLYNRLCIFINGKCHIFSWYDVSGSAPNIKCGKNSLIPKDYQFLFDAVSVTFPPILLDDFETVLTYTRYLNIYNYVRHNITINDGGVFYACNIALRHYKNNIGGNLFQCEGGYFISASYLCDGIKDCTTGSNIDEVGCLCHDTDSYTNKCKYLDKQKETCSFFYFKQKGKCNMFSFYDLFDKNDKLAENFTCGNNITISNKLVNDLIADCGPSAEDEFLLQYSTKVDRIFKCPEPGMLHCINNHPRCFHVSDICNYILDEHNHLFPCRTGSHLENCEQFECNMKFKCPMHYCIPWSYICDSKWDCPHGYDELNETCTNNRECTNMFKCRNSKMCTYG